MSTIIRELLRILEIGQKGRDLRRYNENIARANVAVNPSVPSKMNVLQGCESYINKCDIL